MVKKFHFIPVKGKKLKNIGVKRFNKEAQRLVKNVSVSHTECKA